MFDRSSDYGERWAREAAEAWVVAQDYKVHAAAMSMNTSEDVWVDIARNAPYNVVMSLACNPKVTDKVLEQIVWNKSFTLTQSYKLAARITKNRNCSTSTIYSLLSKLHGLDKRGTEVMRNIAKHKNTPESFVKELLPKGKNSKNIQAENVEACYSTVIPAVMALKASYHLQGYSFHKELIWDKQFPRFVREHKKATGVDVRDWPKEWVEELFVK